MLQSHTETLKRHDEFRRQHRALLQREAELISPRMTGLEAARRMRDMGSPKRVVFLTLQGDPEYLRAALAAGAVG